MSLKFHLRKFCPCFRCCCCCCPFAMISIHSFIHWLDGLIRCTRFTGECSCMLVWILEQFKQIGDTYWPSFGYVTMWWSVQQMIGCPGFCCWLAIAGAKGNPAIGLKWAKCFLFSLGCPGFARVFLLLAEFSIQINSNNETRSFFCWLLQQQSL